MHVHYTHGRSVFYFQPDCVQGSSGSVNDTVVEHPDNNKCPGIRQAFSQRNICLAWLSTRRNELLACCDQEGYPGFLDNNNLPGK